MDKSKVMVMQKSRDGIHSSGVVISAIDGDAKKRGREVEIYLSDKAMRYRKEDDDTRSIAPKKLKASTLISLENMDDLIVSLNGKIKEKEEAIASENLGIASLSGEKENLKKTLDNKKIKLIKKDNKLSSENRYWFGHGVLTKQVDEFVKKYNQKYPAAIYLVNKNQQDKSKLEQERDNAIFDQRVAKLLKEEVTSGYKKENGKFISISANDLDQVYLKYRDAIRDKLQKDRRVVDLSQMTTAKVKAQIGNIKKIIRLEILTPLSQEREAEQKVVDARRAVEKSLQSMIGVKDVGIDGAKSQVLPNGTEILAAIKKEKASRHR